MAITSCPVVSYYICPSACGSSNSCPAHSNKPHPFSPGAHETVTAAVGSQPALRQRRATPMGAHPRAADTQLLPVSLSGRQHTTVLLCTGEVCVSELYTDGLGICVWQLHVTLNCCVCAPWVVIGRALISADGQFPLCLLSNHWRHAISQAGLEVCQVHSSTASQ